MASTVENNVELTVEIPPRALMDFSGRTPMVVVFAVLLAGGVLVLVLVVLGKLSPHTLTTALRTDANRHLANRWPPARFPQLRQASPKSGPALGAAPIQDGDGRGDGSVGSWMTRLSWPQRAATPPAKAYLTPLTVTEDERTLVPVPIPDGDTCLGRDPLLAGILVEDPSVELVHARIRQEHDSYRISDEGSIAGTWVNYTPVSREGITLEHGDLVHIGKVGFRFIRREPGRVQRPVVRPEEPQ